MRSAAREGRALAEAATRAWSRAGTGAWSPATAHAWRSAHPPTFGGTSIASTPWARASRRAESSSTSSSIAGASMPTTVAQRARMGLSPAAAANSTAGAAAVAAGIAASSPSAPGSVARVGAIRAALDRLRVYQDLSKFKLSVFVVSTAATGYALGSGERVDWREMGVVSLGTFLCSASANTFNQVFEKTNDGKMARTMRRPLPAGRCSRAHALAFGVVSGIAGYVLLRTQCNALTANLGVANIAAYALCYTPMKQAHWINTWVGALVGAVPPLMGWAAARDGVEPAGLILAAALYFWQMPHFMALAFMARDDYVRGGYRMMSHPLFDRSGRRVAAVALRNAAAMLPLGLAAVACGLVTPPFAYEAGILAMPMALSSAVFYRRPNVANARRVFYGSLLYLPAFQVLAAAHRVPRTEPRAEASALEQLAAFRVPAKPWAWTAWSVGGWQAWAGEERIQKRRDGFRNGDGDDLGDERHSPPGGLRALGESMHATSAAPFPFLPPPTWPDAKGGPRR